jgi:uncharacterized membrane protein
MTLARERRTIASSSKEAEMHGFTDEWTQFLAAGGTTVSLVLLMLVLVGTLVSGIGALGPAPRA